MDEPEGRKPFNLTPREREELKLLADVIFRNNGNPEWLPETQGKLFKWQAIFRLFGQSRTFFGDLAHLPCDGGLLDQPNKTMECLDILMVSYRENIPRHFRV